MTGSDDSFDKTPPDDDISEHVAISSSTKKKGTTKLMTLPQVTGKLRSEGVKQSPMLTGD